MTDEQIEVNIRKYIEAVHAEFSDAIGGENLRKAEAAFRALSRMGAIILAADVPRQLIVDSQAVLVEAALCLGVLRGAKAVLGDEPFETSISWRFH